MPFHPPEFRFEHRLSDWPRCVLEIRCCQGLRYLPIPLLIQEHGDRTFRSTIDKLRCTGCGQSPPWVWLCASYHRTGISLGPTTDWAIELVRDRSKDPTW